MPTNIKPLDLNQFMEGLKKRNPGEQEFHQAVEEVAACVVASPGNRIDVDALRAHCEKNLGAFKPPSEFHLMEALPKGPSGKIQRLKLVGEIQKSNASDG